MFFSKLLLFCHNVPPLFPVCLSTYTRHLSHNASLYLFISIPPKHFVSLLPLARSCGSHLPEHHIFPTPNLPPPRRLYGGSEGEVKDGPAIHGHWRGRRWKYVPGYCGGNALASVFLRGWNSFYNADAAVLQALLCPYISTVSLSGFFTRGWKYVGDLV